MSKAIRSVVVVVLALAVAVTCAACGSAPDQARPSSSATATQSPEPSAAPGDGQAAAMREQVHSRIDQIMSDIDAAEKRGDVVDGIPVGSSSNPYDYVGISPAFRELIALGAPALPAIVAEIESSKRNGLREYLLAAAGAQIDGDVPGDGQTWDTGKEWARQYRAAN